MCRCENREKVILECANRPFGAVGTVHVGRNELYVDVDAARECFELLGCFVVEAYVSESYAVRREEVDAGAEGTHVFFGGAVLEWLQVNVIVVCGE